MSNFSIKNITGYTGYTEYTNETGHIGSSTRWVAVGKGTSIFSTVGGNPNVGEVIVDSVIQTFYPIQTS